MNRVDRISIAVVAFVLTPALAYATPRDAAHAWITRRGVEHLPGGALRRDDHRDRRGTIRRASW
jgi:hypothetical protein